MKEITRCLDRKRLSYHRTDTCIHQHRASREHGVNLTSGHPGLCSKYTFHCLLKVRIKHTACCQALEVNVLDSHIDVNMGGFHVLDLDRASSWKLPPIIGHNQYSKVVISVRHLSFYSSTVFLRLAAAIQLVFGRWRFVHYCQWCLCGFRTFSIDKINVISADDRFLNGGITFKQV